METLEQMNSEPLVSIIVPAYNMRKYLLDALESIACQTYQSWEIVVIDDCSPETHLDLIDDFRKRHPDAAVKLIRHTTNQRLGGARNTGIKEANGSIYALLDSDDIWAPDHLFDSVSEILRGADLTYCGFRIFHQTIEDSQPGDALDTWGPFPGSLFVHNYITPSGVLIRKDVVERIGYFSTLPEVHMVEDLDYWIRCASNGVRFSAIEKQNLFYRKHPEGATANVARILRAKAHVLFNHRNTRYDAPFIFRRNRISIVCEEAARFTRRKDPRQAVDFYLRSFYAWPFKIKSLAAAIYYYSKSLLINSSSNSCVC